MNTFRFIRCALVIGFLLGSMTAWSQTDAPFDPAVKKGTLKNGMNYFIKLNEEPKDRVSFYFAQNVGSILEKEPQRGLAHFLEHMAFNGTEHFEDKGMLEYLEKNGIRFGAEINAFTDLDRTVYNINQVPVGNEKLIDSVLLILHDWSGYLSLKDEEIDNERGVINEEWRTRNTPEYRASEKIWLQGLLAGSLYQHRMPIGLMEVVNNFKYDELRDYYKKWYRPDQQAVVIVGDVDVDQMEQRVISRFSSIPLREGLPERKEFTIPIEKGFTFVESLDKELGDLSLEYYTRHKHEKLQGTEYYDNSLIASMASYILNSRYDEFTNNENCPALSVYFGTSQFVRPLDIASLSIRPRGGNTKQAFEFAFTEYSRFAKHGATPGELERAQKKFISDYSSALKNKDKYSSDQYATELYDHFLRAVPFTDLEWRYNYAMGKIPQITNEDILAYIDELYSSEAEVVAVKGGTGIEYPDKASFQEMIKDIKEKKLEIYEEEVNDMPLIADELPGSAVKTTYDIENIDAKGYELANGSKIIIYPTEHDKDKIFMSGYSQGGKSLLDKDFLYSAQIATSVAQSSGLGSHDQVSLDKKLAGTDTNLSLRINELSESLSGRSTKTDIEVLFQKIYLSFMQPRFDANIFSNTKAAMEQNLSRKKNQKKSILRDSLIVALENHNDRTILFDETLIETVNLPDIKSVYTDRFKNARDFTFIFVGDIDEQEVLDLAKKYIGSIPSTAATEEFVDHDLEPAKGKTVVSISEEMETPQTTVNIALTGDLEYTPKHSMIMEMIGRLLEKRYMDVIREKEGGSYGVGVYGSLEKFPEENYDVFIQFDCNPEMTERLVQVVYDEIDRLGATVDDTDLNEVKESMIKSYKEAQSQNGFWLQTLSSYVIQGDEIMPEQDYIAMIRSVDKNSIQGIAQTLAKNSDIVEAVMNPESIN